MSKGKRKKKNNITFVIHPTQYNDYDILGIGDSGLLSKLAKKDKWFYLIKNSKFGGISIVIMDTCETLSGARSYIKEYRKLYNNCCKSIQGEGGEGFYGKEIKRPDKEGKT